MGDELPTRSVFDDIISGVTTQPGSADSSPTDEQAAQTTQDTAEALTGHDRAQTGYGRAQTGHVGDGVRNVTGDVQTLAGEAVSRIRTIYAGHPVRATAIIVIVSIALTVLVRRGNR